MTEPPRVKLTDTAREALALFERLLAEGFVGTVEFEFVPGGGVRQAHKLEKVGFGKIAQGNKKP